MAFIALVITAAQAKAQSANINNIIFIDGVQYPATGAGVRSALNYLLSVGGGTLIIPSGTNVNITSGPLQVGEVGSPVKPINLTIQPGGKLSCNFNSSSTDCIQLGDASKIDCISSTLVTPSIQVVANANVNTVIAPMNRAGLQESYIIHGCSIDGGGKTTQGSNIVTAVIDMTSLADNTIVSDNTIFGYHSNTAAPGILYTPGNTTGGGPIVIDHNWLDTGAPAPCYVITDGNGKNYTTMIYLTRNECQNSLTAPYMTISAGVTGHTRHILVDGFYALGSSSSKLIDVNGCWGCRFKDVQLSTTAAAGVTGIYFENTVNANTANVVENLAIFGTGFSNGIFDAQSNFGSGGSPSSFQNYHQPDNIAPMTNALQATTIYGNEVAAPAGAGSAIDLMWPDSSDHRWKMNNNNDGVDFVVGQNTTDVLKNKTIDGPNGLLISQAAPTISSGFGASPSIVHNGAAAFVINVGTGGSATSGIIGLPDAPTGWNCWTNDITAAAAHVPYNTRQIASSINSATLENEITATGAAVAWRSGDILSVSCFAY